ncbi:hypothetical protein ULMS_05660 [Patiriisocius marinistellae]|uniref:PKD domain-containing protein n=1 Tax=Patiriisocius marinistellae TaxID=2494560 RepID=A0A5J4FV36_9FLAO|nr:T9SS type B sorting domain-containing protein [Patiriisocius marinistellae]GEQ85058.1 hypothetical protein ULMS_05660 [Patiriisocius marinistellae]
MHLYLRFLTLIFTFFITFCTFAQGEANIWYFGENAGLDFNSGTPVPLLDGELFTQEGCSTISNANGQLLFYTDGITVWDKQHNIMPNGNGLLGNPSSTQSGIIVPKPGFSNIYYIFSVDFQANINGLTYSEVDLSLNGGNGDVTSIKNVSLSSPTTEKITAIEHDNGTDYWVVAHEWESNNFISYEVTAAGVNTTPVVSAVGEYHGEGNGSDGNNAIGYMKISPDGERLALAQSYTDSFVEIFDFNSLNGSVSNPIFIQGIFYENGEGAYGLEFSPNNELLYISDVDGSISKIHQLNITLNNATDIINSDTILYDGGNFIGGIQLAIDGRIYLTNALSPFLDVIENPNEIGTAAGYVSQGLSLNGRNAVYGLPPFIQSFFNVGFEVDNTCFGNETLFTLDSNEEITSILWDFGDGTTSTVESPTHTYTAVGTYIVNVTVDTIDNTRTLTQEVTIYKVPLAANVEDFVLCDESDSGFMAEFDLDTKIIEVLNGQSDIEFDVAFYENLMNAENDTNRLPLLYTNTSNNQEIFARIYNAGNSDCDAINSFFLIVEAAAIANPVDDVVLCEGGNTNGRGIIDLNQFNSVTLLQQSPDDFSVTYHSSQEDADNADGALSPLYQISSNSQELFIRVENNNNIVCYDTTSFLITIDGIIIANRPETLYLCDDPSKDRVETFNLTTQNEFIINDQTGNYTISYFKNQLDASNGTNPINSSYTNTSNPETIFARIQDSANAFCYDTTSFSIRVLQSPDIVLQETGFLCTDETLTLNAEIGYDEYLWSTGETTSSIVVDAPGTYSVLVTDNIVSSPFTSCSATKTITVIESNEAQILSIDIEDWSANDNTIIVNVTGIGDYEYSLNGVQYQDSHIFTNVANGNYTVFVRDKNTCGIVNEDVLLLFYPVYFTPNNDGYHDKWQLFNAGLDGSLEIYIFDRYGKLLIIMTPDSEGWDGTFKNKKMPSSDYWFKVVRPSIGVIYHGHFSLKR